MGWNRINRQGDNGSAYRYKAVNDGGHSSCGHLHKSYDAAQKCSRRLNKDGNAHPHHFHVAVYERAEG